MQFVQSRKALNIFILAFLTILCLSRASLISAAEGPPQDHGKVPGMPGDALQFNRTDITPNGHMERITANKTHVFFYRNVTLMLNCNRNFDLNLTIDSKVRTRLFSLLI